MYVGMYVCMYVYRIQVALCTEDELLGTPHKQTHIHIFINCLTVCDALCLTVCVASCLTVCVASCFTVCDVSCLTVCVALYPGKNVL